MQQHTTAAYHNIHSHIAQCMKTIVLHTRQITRSLREAKLVPLSPIPQYYRQGRELPDWQREQGHGWALWRLSAAQKAADPQLGRWLSR